jgi:hypothetical protein
MYTELAPMIPPMDTELANIFHPGLAHMFDL